MAAISKKQKVLSLFTRFLNVIETKRAIDFSFTGQGTILKIEQGIVYGKDTVFEKEIKAGFLIRIGKDLDSIQVKEVISDTQLRIIDNEKELTNK